MRFLILVRNQISGPSVNIDCRHFFASRSLTIKRFDPDVIFLFSSTHNIESLPTFEIFVTQLDASLNFDLVHAAIFFLSIHIASRFEYTLLRAEIVEPRIFNWGF